MARALAHTQDLAQPEQTTGFSNTLLVAYGAGAILGPGTLGVLAAIDASWFLLSLSDRADSTTGSKKGHRRDVGLALGILVARLANDDIWHFDLFETADAGFDTVIGVRGVTLGMEDIHIINVTGADSQSGSLRVEVDRGAQRAVHAT